MRDRMIDVGGTVVNIDRVDAIQEASADKVRRILMKYGIDKNSDRVINATSEKETKSIIFLSNGRIIISSFSANILSKRMNADHMSE